MPSRRVIFHRLAANEFRDARQWYATRSALAEEKFRAAARASLERIINDPGFLAPIDETYRRVRVRGFPYILIFRELPGDLMLVVAVAHTSRRPGYWRRRKEPFMRTA
jgi:hypothetical protein